MKSMNKVEKLYVGIGASTIIFVISAYTMVVVHWLYALPAIAGIVAIWKIENLINKIKEKRQ